MIPITEARERSRIVHTENEEIKRQEGVIDSAIRNASANGQFGTIVQLSNMMDVVMDKYRSIGYNITPKYSTFPNPSTNSYTLLGYYIYWGEDGDTAPITY